MDTTAFLRWLQGTLADSGAGTKKRILRFERASDYRRFVHEWAKTSSAQLSLVPLKEMKIIHAVSCPLPDDLPPPRFWDSLWIEDDMRIKVHGTLRKPAAWEKGIPWGVKQIKAPSAWSATTGHQINVGVIDTGADYNHPDLRHSLASGINLLNRSMLPYDDNGHGTHIAGTIAAANSMQGMIGVAPRAFIHPVKAFDHNGSAYVSDIIMGIDWCVRNRIQVINMSFGMKSPSKPLLSAINNAYSAGIAVVASSGNDGKRRTIDYPARYSQTVSVGATARLRRVASFSNRGKFIDIYAPGEKIVSAWLQGKYFEMSGTSMATSHVSGAIALLLAHRPGLSPSEIKAILKRSAQPLRGQKAPQKTGELDVARMLKAADA
jgi:subtilisin